MSPKNGKKQNEVGGGIVPTQNERLETESNQTELDGERMEGSPSRRSRKPKNGLPELLPDAVIRTETQSNPISSESAVIRTEGQSNVLSSESPVLWTEGQSNDASEESAVVRPETQSNGASEESRLSTIAEEPSIEGSPNVENQASSTEFPSLNVSRIPPSGFSSTLETPPSFFSLPQLDLVVSGLFGILGL